VLVSWFILAIRIFMPGFSLSFVRRSAWPATGRCSRLFAHTQIGGQGRHLKRTRDAAAQAFMIGFMRHVMNVEDDLPFRAWQCTSQNVKQRGLARPIRTNP